MLQTLFTLIAAAVATGAGQSIKLPVPTNEHAVEIYFVDDTTPITALTVDLEMSFDPSESTNDATAKWHQIGQKAFSAGEITAKKAVLHVTGKVANRIRANITALTGGDGSTDTITVRYIPKHMGGI